MGVKPRVHHLVQERRRQRVGVRPEQSCRQLDERRPVCDASGDRRQPGIVRDAVRLKRSTEMRRIQTREEQLEIALRWQLRSLGARSRKDVLHSGA